MANRIECACGKVLKVPSKYAGRKLRCTGCQRTMRLSAPVEEPPRPEPSTIGCVGCGARFAASVRVCLRCGSDPVSGEPLYADAEAEQA